MQRRHSRSSSCSSLLDFDKTLLTDYDAIISLIKATVGEAVLFLPLGFATVGIQAGMMVLSAVMLTAYIGFTFLLSSYRFLSPFMSQRPVEEHTFDHIVDLVLGRVGGIIARMTLFLLQFGACIGYILFIAENLQFSLKRIYNVTWTLYRCVWTLSPFIVAVLLPRNLTQMSKLYAFATYIQMSCLAYMIGYLLRHITEHGTHPLVVEPTSLELFGFAGAAFYAIGGAPLYIPIVASMQNPARFSPIFQLSNSIVFVLYATLAALGALAFGNRTKAIVFLNLEQGYVFNAILILFSLSILLSLQLQSIPAVAVFERVIQVKGHFARILYALCALAVASAGGTFAIVLQIIGSLAACTVAVTLPSIVYLRLYSPSLRFLQRLGLVCLILSGVLVSVMGCASVYHEQALPIGESIIE